jgi:hypothetical protein
MMSALFFSGLSQRLWVNLLGFNLIWALCIFYGNSLLPLVILLLLLHLLLHRQPALELAIVVGLGSLGYALDSVLTLLGLFRFESVQSIAPLWLLLLWFGFCATLRQSLSFFRSHLLLAALVGAMGGGFAYLAAANFGAVTLGLPALQSGLLIALIWALLFPAFLRISQLCEVRVCTG